MLLYHKYLLGESIITTIAAFPLPAVMPLPTDGGIVNNTTNCSSPSTASSEITGTPTLLIIVPLSNIAVSGAVLKSTPPISQTLFSQHIIIHTILPSADTGDCSDGVTVTLNGLAELPFIS